MTTQSIPSASTAASARRWPAIIAGCLLLLPGAICCGTSLLAPTVQTVLLSMQKANGLGPASYVGAANFASLAGLRPLSQAVSFTVTLAVERLLAVLIVPALLALAAAALNGWARGGLRLLFTLPLALFAPTGLAAAWLITRVPGSSPLGSVAGAQGTLLSIDGAQTLGLACGVGLITYLAALRPRADGSAGWAAIRWPLLLTWFISGLAALATGLQVFALPYLLTRGGPAAATTTLTLLQYQLAFVNFQFGQAAAVAVLNLAALALLGLLAGLLLVLSGARLELAPAGRSSNPLMPVILAVAVVVVLGLAAFVIWASGQAPLFQTAGLALSGEPQRSAASPAGNSLIGPLTVLLLQLPLAYLAALGISALRPLGRWSEWLLLPFSPWLFVTVGPLSVAEFTSLRQAGQLNNMARLAPPLLLSVPMLFVLALFFRSRYARWQSSRAGGQSAVGAFLRQVVAPSIPLALLVGVVGMLVNNQELLWPLLVASKPELYTGNVALALQLGQLSARRAALAGGVMSVVLPGALLGLVALGVLQVAYVGRLALRTGQDAEPKPGADT
jgi:ABC-type sugar transport system permease subunit